ncbi:MAG: hypothetical protein MZV63_15225 [Marinilabiliales bacterium]|nr:hypothetical protein [Marinilabiliales bacterium]
MPFASLDWFTPVKNVCEPGENAEILIGTSDKNVRVLYEIEHRGTIVHSEYLTLSNEQKLIKIPIREAHRGNITAIFSFIRQGRVFTHQAPIMVPWTNKQLTLRLKRSATNCCRAKKNNGASRSPAPTKTK